MNIFKSVSIVSKSCFAPRTVASLTIVAINSYVVYNMIQPLESSATGGSETAPWMSSILSNYKKIIPSLTNTTYCEGSDIPNKSETSTVLSDIPTPDSSTEATTPAIRRENERKGGKQLSAEDLRYILGSSTLINAKNESITVDSLVGKTIAVYFSASWCPPCRRFTPVLSETYQKIQERLGQENGADSDVEFILVTGDLNESDFDANRQKMPFPAVPFKEAKGRLGAFKQFFHFQTIPHLVVIRSDGKVTNGDATQAVYGDRLGQKFPWWDTKP